MPVSDADSDELVEALPLEDGERDREWVPETQALEDCVEVGESDGDAEPQLEAVADWLPLIDPEALRDGLCEPDREPEAE